MGYRLQFSLLALNMSRIILKRSEHLRAEGRKLFYRYLRLQMNAHDSETLAGILELMGYIQAEEKNKADIIIFNTCCVRENAENRIKGNIGAVKPIKEKRPELITVVCGCMTQQPGRGGGFEKNLWVYRYYNGQRLR